MTTCQTAANEFLRQFWSATYPPPVDSSILSIATPTQRAAKAAKMIGYLAKTSEKVEALLRMAQQHGVDGSRVEQVRAFNRSPSACLFMDECLSTPRP
jgi:transcription initiation factor TFIIH subunit 1